MIMITMLIVSKVAEPRRAGRKEDDGLDDEEEVSAVGINIIIIIIIIIFVIIIMGREWKLEEVNIVCITGVSLDPPTVTRCNNVKENPFVLIAIPQIPTRASLVKASAAFLNAKGGVARAKHGKHSWRRK